MDNTNLNRLYLAEGIDFDMDCHKTGRNLNTLVVGASGCGKSRSVVTPNLLACSGSYVISDPKGTLYENYHDFMEQHGYRVRKVDLVRLDQGEGFNFFQGLDTEDDILSTAVSIQESHNDRNHQKYDMFWDHSERLALSGAIGCIMENAKLLAYPWQEIPESIERAQKSGFRLSGMILRQVLSRRENPYSKTIQGINNVLDDLQKEVEAPDAMRESCAGYYIKDLLERESRSSKLLHIHTELEPQSYRKLRALEEKRCHILGEAEGTNTVVGLLRFADAIYDQVLAAASRIGSQTVWEALRSEFLCDFSEKVRATLERILSHDLSSRYSLLCELRPDCFGVRQLLRLQNLSADRTFSNIMITTQAPLSTLDTEAVNGMMLRAEKQPFDFASIGTQKTALFVVVSDSDRRMDAFANLFFAKALKELTLYADTKCRDHTLPIHVRFFFDDFATNVRLEEMPRSIASFRSRNISTCLIIQSEAQLEQYYGKDAQTIVANCDHYLFAGTQSLRDAEVISKKTNKPLEDILYMPISGCIVFRRGDKPRFAKLIDHDRFLKWVGFSKDFNRKLPEYGDRRSLA